MQKKTSTSSRSRAEILAEIAALPPSVQGRISSYKNVRKNGTTVTVYAVSAAKFGKETFSANKTGNVKGVAELYDSKLEIIPTCSADVAAFK